MNSISSYLSSSIGRKWIVALTGLGLFGFVVGHLIGNLQVFLGPEPLNRYALFLQSLGELLWVIRLGLLAMVVAHIIFTIKLRMENRAARPVGYAVTNRRAATFPARMMTLSGLMVLCFIIFHLLHFTAHKIDPSFAHMTDAMGRHDVYGMLILGFKARPRRLLHRRRRPAGDAPKPRHRQPFPNPRPEERESATAVGERRGRPVVADLPRLRLHPRRRPYRSPEIMSAVLDSKIPTGPLSQKWEKHKFESKLINPANRRKYEIIVVGSGLAGASAAASLGDGL